MEEENNLLHYPAAKELPQRKSGAGMAFGIILCGLAIALFPRAFPMPPTVTLIFGIVGFILVLLGILGTCAEFDNWRNRQK